MTSWSSAAVLAAPQILTRGLTFGLNAVVLRRVAPEVVGQAAMLDLKGGSVLVAAREAGRLACQRASGPVVVTAGWLAVAVGSILAYFAFSASLPALVYLVATVVELLGEPWYLLSQKDLRTRAYAESCGSIARCLATAIGVYTAPPLLAFAYGQLGYACAVSATYVARAPAHTSLVPMASLPASFLAHYALLMVQTVFKHLLTESDKLVTAYLCSESDRGVYTVVSNYGLLAARLVFAPIEESVRLAGAQANIDMFLSGYVVMGIGVVLFGVPNARLLFGALVARQWRELAAPAVARAYAVYVPLMAVNGVVEAKFQGNASPAALARQAVAMGVLLAVYFAVCYGLVQRLDLGLYGFVAANSVNMVMRAAYCWDVGGGTVVLPSSVYTWSAAVAAVCAYRGESGSVAAVAALAAVAAVWVLGVYGCVVRAPAPALRA